MRVQIEITTRCNFDCFYCAGRDMRQADMPFDQFRTILVKHIENYGVPSEVSLQGEGEPTLHKDFSAMAELVKELGSRPYTITNGSHKQPGCFSPSFQKIGVSIDTLNSQYAEKIGRYQLSRVLAFVEKSRLQMQVIVHTVAIADDLADVAEYCQKRGLHHIVQPLQAKPDYRYRYPHFVLPLERPEPFACLYLRQPLKRFYNLDGVEMACCFIKSSRDLPDLEAMQIMERNQHMPGVCSGCQFGLVV